MSVRNWKTSEKAYIEQNTHSVMNAMLLDEEYVGLK
jgi:hypothetical protein